MFEVNQFTERFIQVFLQEFPQWENYIQIMQDDERYSDGTIYIEIPAPNIMKNGSIRVTTDNNEVTIGFYDYHDHFISLDENEGFEEAINFIKDIINEKKAVVITMNEEDDFISFVVDTSELPNFQSGYVVSWNGTFDQEKSTRDILQGDG